MSTVMLRTFSMRTAGEEAVKKNENLFNSDFVIPILAICFPVKVTSI